MDYLDKNRCSRRLSGWEHARFKELCQTQRGLVLYSGQLNLLWCAMYVAGFQIGTVILRLWVKAVG